MIGPANADAATKSSTHVPAVTTAAVVTIAAAEEDYWVIDTVTFSYDQAPGSAETLTIAYGTGPTTKLTIHIPNDVGSAGPQQIIFPRGFHYDSKTKNEQCVVTLSAPTAGSGTVTVTYR